MAKQPSTRSRRFRVWWSRYDIELGLGVVVAIASWKIIGALDTAPAGTYTAYQSIMLVSTLLILFVVTVIMSNVARTRTATERLTEAADNGRKR